MKDIWFECSDEDNTYLCETVVYPISSDYIQPIVGMVTAPTVQFDKDSDSDGTNEY